MGQVKARKRKVGRKGDHQTARNRAGIEGIGKTEIKKYVSENSKQILAGHVIGDGDIYTGVGRG